MFTPHQTQYFAWQLTRRLSSEDEDKLTGAIMDAQIDLNPHQVDAALFAFKNPFSKGVLLADEVGLGKTIEAGLVIAQKWAERKRRILIIVPSSMTYVPEWVEASGYRAVSWNARAQTRGHKRP